MDMDIQSWVTEITQLSEYQPEYRPYRKDEYPEDYNSILDAFPTEGASFRGCGILLTGNDHFSREAVVVKMLERLESGNCGHVFLDGMELCEDGAATAKARLDGLMDYFYDEGKSLCLILEEMEDCPCRREILKFLGHQLWVSLADEAQLPLFLILIDNREHEIPGLLRNRLTLCRTNIPNLAQRTAYVEKQAGYLKEYLSFEQFAKLTEGADYAQLRDIIKLAYRMIESLDRPLTEEEQTELLAGQMPPATPESATQKFYQAVEKLTEQLPEMLRDMAEAARSSSATAAAQVAPIAVTKEATLGSSILNDATYLDNKRKEIEEMPPNKLCEDIFGERMHELLS